mgnify:CR=1 FL=1
MRQHFVIYGIFSLLAASISFAIVPFLSHYLSKEDFGFIGLFMIVMKLFAPIIGLSMNSIISRSYYLRKDLGELLGSAFILIFVLTVLVFWVLILLPDILYVSLGFKLELALIGLISAFFMTISVTLLAFLQMQEKPVYWGIAMIANTLVSVALTFLLIVLFELDYLSRLLGILVGQIFSALIAYYFSKKFIKISFTLNLDHYRYFYKLGLPLLFTALSGWALISLDRVFIGSILGMEATGLYVFAITLASPVYIIQDVYTRVWGPNAFKMLSKQEEIKLLKWLVYSFVGYIFLGLLFATIAPYLYRIIIGPDFFDSLFLLPWLVFGIVVQGLQNLLLPFIMHHGKLKVLSYCAVIGLIVNVLCNFWFIPNMGIQGAALAAIVTNGMISVMYSFYVLKNFYFNTLNIVPDEVDRV